MRLVPDAAARKDSNRGRNFTAGTLGHGWRLTCSEVAMADVMQRLSDRESHLRRLADGLLFNVEKTGDRFTLARTIDVEQPVRHDGLTLGQAEQLLETWKLRGPHGG
jgi:hypothetical protein